MLTHAALTNAWLLCAPMVLLGGFVALRHPAAARRMADMAGYSRREALVTKAASLAPYPFIALSVFTPLTAPAAVVIAGVMLALVGLAGLTWTLAVFVRTAPGALLLRGPYSRSRNPMYVSAALVFAGTCIATASPLLIALLVVLLVLQHGMIRAEERVCSARYPDFASYMRRVPRYLGRTVHA